MTGPGPVGPPEVDGDPLHQLLTLLHHHRVLTTSQLVKATGAADRTVRHRLARLRNRRLIASVRPGRTFGSAPAHWWLTPAGTRTVSGNAAGQPRRTPSAQFLAHAAAVADVWLALAEHGPTAGLRLVNWWPHRTCWQEWNGQPGQVHTPEKARRRLTPDAALHAALGTTGMTTGIAAALVEVDLATMTQAVLRDKVTRYAAYASARAWQNRHPNCPPLLILTTTTSRAATFTQAVHQLLQNIQHDPAAGVVTCGLVHDPAAAVIEPVWKPAWRVPGQTAPELTLTEVLAAKR